MPCQCLLGKSPAFIARDEMLTDEALHIYGELTSPDWTADDSSPEELVEAVDAVQSHWGQRPSGEYSEAADWCAHIVSERALEADGLVPADTTRREADAERATSRREPEGGSDESDSFEVDGLRDIVVSLFIELESEDWTAASGSDPIELEYAVDNYRAEIDENCSEDYADACEIAGALFDNRHPSDDLAFMVTTVVDCMGHHRAWRQACDRATARATSPEGEPEGDSCPVICLDSYRASGALVTL